MYLLTAQSPGNLGYFRPNQSYDRGIYGVGDDTDATAAAAAPAISADPSTLLVGLAALAAAFFLLGGNITPKIRRAEASRLKGRREAISKRIAVLES